MVQEIRPYLKFLTGTLGMVLPVASSAVKLALDETAYKLIEEQLDFGKSMIDATIGETGKVSDFSAQRIPPISNMASPSALMAPPCANSTPCSKPKTLASAVLSA